VSERIWRLVDRVERGRRPVQISMAASGVLGILSVGRFVVLVAVMDPADYGRLSVFVALAMLLPYFVTWGASLQFQRITRFSGPGAMDVLARWGFKGEVIAAPLALLVAGFVSAPFTEGDPRLVLFVTIQALGLGFVSLMAQALLGLRYRTLSALVSFASNAAPTMAVLVLLPLGLAGDLTAVLGSWAIAMSVAAVASLATARLVAARMLRHEPALSRPSVPHLREGLTSIPTLAGAWLLLLITRVHLGTALGNEQLASFSLAWTAADLSFLISVTLITTASTAIMDGSRSPLRMFVRSACILLALLAMAGLAVPIALALFAREGYTFSYGILALTGLATLGRLAVSAWLPVSVRARSVWILSGLFLIAAALLAALFTAVSLPTAEAYAAGLAIACLGVGFTHAAVSARWVDRHPQREDGDSGGKLAGAVG
jgi:hypothetical protein